MRRISKNTIVKIVEPAPYNTLAEPSERSVDTIDDQRQFHASDRRPVARGLVENYSKFSFLLEKRRLQLSGVRL